MAKTSRKPAPIVALGTMTFGGQTSDADARRMLDMFFDAGHSWVDTAYMYTEGKSETILGKLLKGRKRDRAFIATKAYPGRLGPGKPQGLTPGSLRGQLETSLQRMKLDCADLFYLHAPDNQTPLEDTLGAVQQLREEGKLRELGLSNYAAWQVAEVAGLCERHGWDAPLIYQGMYNAVTRDVERECLPACRHFGVDFIAYNPLAGGMLTGKYSTMATVPDSGRFSGQYYRNRFWKTEYFEAVRQLEETARKLRLPLGHAALRWMLRHSKADGIVLGASKVEHLKDNLAACTQGPLSDAMVMAFDAAWDITRPVCDRYFRDESSIQPALGRAKK